MPSATHRPAAGGVNLECIINFTCFVSLPDTIPSVLSQAPQHLFFKYCLSLELHPLLWPPFPTASFSLLLVETNLYFFYDRWYYVMNHLRVYSVFPVPNGSCSKARMVLFSYSIWLLLSKCWTLSHVREVSISQHGSACVVLIHESKPGEYWILYGGDKNPSPMRHALISYFILWYTYRMQDAWGQLLVCSV